jgi:hypothetical protein
MPGSTVAIARPVKATRTCPDLAAGQGLDVARHRRQPAQERLDAFQEGLAGRRQLDPRRVRLRRSAPRAVSSWAIAAAQRRLRHGQRLGGFAKMELPRHLAEVDEVPEFERDTDTPAASQGMKQVFPGYGKILVGFGHW